MALNIGPTIIYLPFGGGGAKYKGNRDAQINSWVKDVTSPCEVLHICGDQRLLEPQVDNGVLTLPLSEAFENGLERQLLALKWVIKNRNFDWVCFSNTSNYFDHRMLQDYIRRSQSFKVAATIGRWDDDTESILFPSGAGTLIDYETCLLLSDFDPKPFMTLSNDVALGKILAKLQIPIHPMPRVNVTDWDRFEDHFHYRVKHWHYSQITSFRMKLIWKIKNSQGLTRFASIKILNISQVIFQKTFQLKRILVRGIFCLKRDGK
jgi:hypothetical protein